jgi:hypothetical protein
VGWGKEWRKNNKEGVDGKERKIEGIYILLTRRACKTGLK